MKQGANTFSIGRTTRVCPCHACAFFTSKEEEYRVMLPFMAEGLEAGDKLVHILDKNRRGEWLTRLMEAGIDAATAEQSGQLEVLPWEQAQVIDGHFGQHRMLASLERGFAEDDKRYKVTRLWSNQEWALQDLPGVGCHCNSQMPSAWPRLSALPPQMTNGATTKSRSPTDDCRRFVPGKTDFDAQRPIVNSQKPATAGFLSHARITSPVTRLPSSSCRFESCAWRNQKWATGTRAL